MPDLIMRVDSGAKIASEWSSNNSKQTTKPKIQYLHHSANEDIFPIAVTTSFLNILDRSKVCTIRGLSSESHCQWPWMFQTCLLTGSSFCQHCRGVRVHEGHIWWLWILQIGPLLPCQQRSPLQSPASYGRSNWAPGVGRYFQKE